MDETKGAKEKAETDDTADTFGVTGTEDGVGRLVCFLTQWQMESQKKGILPESRGQRTVCGMAGGELCHCSVAAQRKAEAYGSGQFRESKGLHRQAG